MFCTCPCILVVLKKTVMEDAIGESLFTFFASLTNAFHYLIAEANEIKTLIIEKA